ncbi:MAG: hypothetical protein ACD_5C00095G0002 [uncultured bacterium]|nr:MAG: hypothetical protein ACD_5C00095G0002 [uncultured bacterium]
MPRANKQSSKKLAAPSSKITEGGPSKAPEQAFLPELKVKVENKKSYLDTDTSLDARLSRYAKADWKILIDQVQAEYDAAFLFMKPKHEEWGLRLKLYNNQKRDKEAVGDNLMFTVHQTVLASLYSDKLTSEFNGREQGDDETAETLNTLAIFDEDDMEKDILDYEWDWDASFFGRGLCLFNEFDRVTKTPMAEIIDPMTWLRDSRAKSVNGDRKRRGAMRYGGREIRMTMNEMKEAGIYFNFEDMADDTKDVNSVVDRNMELRAQAQGLGTVANKSLAGENKDFRLLEWFTIYNGKKVLVTLASNRTRVVRYTELTNAEGKPAKTWPIIDRPFYPMAHDWDSVSIPDLTEDKQRARAVLQNLSLKGAKMRLHPMTLFDTNKITNKADLNFEFGKNIGVNGNPNNAAVPLQTSGVNNEVQWVMELLDTAAQRATATPEMQQGSVGAEKRTLGEINLIASKVDTRYSLSAKIFGWSEKRFWKQWYALYKKHFKDGIDEKTIRISGAMGSQWRKLTRENIVLASNDPDIKIESKIISEERRLQNLQMFRAFIKDVLAVAGQEANLRFALKRLGKLSGMTKDEIDRVLPPTYDEMESEDENEKLSNGEIVEVNPMDDDMIHLETHNKAADTPEKYAHQKAHKLAMLLKKERPELFPQKQNVDPNQIQNLMDKMQGLGGVMPNPAAPVAQ